MSKDSFNAPVEFIQSLRGIALLSVLGIHSVSFFSEADPGSPLGIVLVFVLLIFIVAVPLFVWISGFVLALQYFSSMDVKVFFRRRFSTIIPSYLFFSVAYVFFSAFDPQSSSWHFPKIQTFLVLILTGSSYSHLWFILLLIQFYLLFPLLCNPKVKASLIKHSLIWIASAFILQTFWQLFIPSLASSLFLDSTYDRAIILLISRSFPAYLGFFVTGLVMGARYKKKGQHAIQIKTALLVLVLVVLTGISLIGIQWIQGIHKFGSIYTTTEAHRWIEKILYPVVYLSMIFLYLKISVSPKTKGELKKHLAYLGDRSFGIYLLHAGVLIFLAHILKMMGITPNQVAFYVLLFSATLILSLLLEEIMARIPFTSKLIGRKIKNPSLFPVPFPKSDPKSCG
jgi:surface polysaccharide O-acyltransferase-like enzyme